MARWTHFTIAAMCLPWIMVSSVGAQEIKACMNKKSGVLRVVADQGQCKKNETPISWNQTVAGGPQGPAGP